MAERIGKVPPEVVAAEQARMAARAGQPEGTVAAGQPGEVEAQEVGSHQVESTQAGEVQTQGAQTAEQPRVGEPLATVEDQRDGRGDNQIDTDRATERTQTGAPEGVANAAPGQPDVRADTRTDNPTKDGTIAGPVELLGPNGERTVVFEPGTRNSMTPSPDQQIGAVGPAVGGRAPQERVQGPLT